VALAVAGCATAEMRVASVSVASRRLAALPSEGTVSDYDLAGNKTNSPGETVTAKKNFDDAVNYRLRRHGGRAFEGATIDGLPHAYAFHLWIVSTLKEIRAEHLGRTHETDETPGDWRFSNSLRAWRAVLDADFILVSLFTDARKPPYISPAILVGGALAVGVEIAFRASRMDGPDTIACVVHLETSRIVWCKFESMKEDLTLRAGAQTDVDSLLDEMLVAGDGAPIELPPTGPLTGQVAAADPGPVPPRKPTGLHAP
jgi:hypothetical protein